jgi:hypothetical protein
VTKGPDCSKAYLQKIANGEETPMDEETNTRNEVKEYLDTLTSVRLIPAGEY